MYVWSCYCARLEFFLKHLRLFTGADHHRVFLQFFKKKGYFREYFLVNQLDF